MTGDSSSVVIGHWGEVVNGGGERVAWELARCFDAPLYVGVRTPDIEPEDVTVRDLFADTPTRHFIERGGFLRMLGQQAGWGTAHRLRDHDALITTGNECLAYVPAARQPWVHYVHHTSRYATDRLPDIEDKHDGFLEPLVKRVEYAQRWTERQIYGRYAQKPTLLVANSEPVKRRITTYWGVPEDHIEVVYPPVPTEEFDPAARDTGDYYLTLSRLDWHKNIDEIVAAFNNLGEDYQLVVAGDGPERDALEAMAEDNVTFAGYVSEARKRELLAGARGFVFAAQAEDFGIAPVEALAAGTPVIGVDEGFTRYQVRDGETGYRWDRDEDGSLVDAIRRLERKGVDWSEAEIATFARLNFGTDRFHRAMHALLAEARDRHALDISFDLPVSEGDTADETATAVPDGGDDA